MTVRKTTGQGLHGHSIGSLMVGILLCASTVFAQTASVTLAWDPSPDPTVTGYKIHYGTSSRVYSAQVPVGKVTTATIPGLTAGVGYYFTATAHDASGLESDYCNEVFYQPAVVVPNQPPTLDTIANLSIQENTQAQINLTGISSGDSGQSVTISAVSSNPALVPNPTISYLNPSTTATLALAPVLGAFGTATITVTVNDGQASNGTFSRSFVVTVSHINQPPTLNPINNLSLNENAGAQTVQLSGISSGAQNEQQTLTITAVSSNPSLIPNPAVNYASPSATGTLTFTPVQNANGSATITVTVNDGQTANNTLLRTFVVSVGAANRPPTLDPLTDVTIDANAGTQTVPLKNITSGLATENQTLTVTAVSANQNLIPNPTISYVSPNTTGTLSFTPVTNASGSAMIAVTVFDGQPKDSTITRLFVVTVNPPNPTNRPPTLDALANVTVQENAPIQTMALMGISSGAASESQPLTISAVSSNPDIIPHPSVNYTSPNATGLLSFTPVAYAFGTATITVTVSDGQASNGTFSRSFAIIVNPVNQPPTLNPIANLSLNENAAPQTVPLSGISSGAQNEQQTLTITAVSSNPSLVPNPAVNYSSPGTTGTLTFTPVQNAYGSATITVTVNDGQSTDNTFVQSFLVSVGAANRPPTLDALANMTIQENSGAQTVQLKGITAGLTSEQQTLTVSAVSSNPGLIPNPAVSYLSPGTTGTLSFTPVTDAFGSATITVTVSDGQATDSTVTRSFVVTVNAINRPPTLDALANVTVQENAPIQTMALMGISSGATFESQTLTITAVSSNPEIIANPSVNYTSPNATGLLSFTPVAYAFGTATITVTISDGQTSNGTFSRSFVITVNAVNQPPTLNAISNLSLNENVGAQIVQLSGISSGAQNEQQTLTTTAVSSNPALIPNPTVNYSSPAATGTLTFTPVQNAYGSATITVTVNDGQSADNTVVQSFVVSVGAANRPPTLDALANMTLQENSGPQIVQLKGISAGLSGENQALTVTAVSSNPALIPNPAVSYLSPGTTGTLTFTPATDAFGTATVTVTVSDGQAMDSTVTRSFAVTVNPINRPPTLDALANVTIQENAPIQTLALMGISPGATFENQTLTISAVSSNPEIIANPSVNYTSPNATGLLSFTPVAYAFGTATITVTVNDGQASNGTFSRSFVITVSPVNQPPTLNALANLSLNENAGTQIVQLSGISSGAQNEQQGLTITAVSSNPSLIPNPAVSYSSPGATGTLTFAPIENAFGSATITVTVNDGQSTDNMFVQSFVVSVGAANRPPTLDALANVTIQENATAQTVQLKGISTGLAGENQMLTLTAVSSNPSLIPNPSVSYVSPNATGTLSFTPTADTFGTATVTVTVSDGQATDSTITRSFVVTVTALNRPPTLNPLANVTIQENAPIQTVTLSGIGAGAAFENQPLSVTAVSSNPQIIPHPSVNYTSPNATGLLSFTPVAYAFGTATITVTISDGQVSNSTITRSFAITVTPVNQPPTLNPIGNLSLNENAGAQTVQLSGIGSGTQNEQQTLTITAVSSNPSVIPNPVINYSSPNATGVLTFTPVQNAYGSATITVTVNDGQSSDNTFAQSFVVSVGAANRPPTLDALANVSIQENAAAQTVQLKGISTGLAGENQTLTITAFSSNPSLIPNPLVSYVSPNATATLSFRPVTDAFGSATITVTVNDGQPADSTVTRSFVVTVNPANRPPTLDALANVTIQENAPVQTLGLTGISSGAAFETQPLTITAVSSNPQIIPHPSVNYTSPNATGLLSFTPVAYAFGSATITVTVNDGQASNGTFSRSFVVTVNPINQPPTLNPISNISLNENAGAQSVQLSGISSGAQNEQQSLTITAVSSNPSLIPNPMINYSSPSTSGTLTFTPITNVYGSAIITVTVNDGQSTENTIAQSFVVSVGAANRPPTLDALLNVTIQENAGAQTVQLRGISTGLAGENQTLTVTAVSSNPTLIPNPSVSYVSPNTTGTLSFTPITDKFGSTTITVTISDGQPADSTITRSFVITVNPLNRAPTLNTLANVTIQENAGVQTVALSGISAGAAFESQALTITAVSSNPELIPHPSVNYTSPNATGLLSFTPVAYAFGSATITVTVSDGQASNGTFSRSFVVTVNPVNQPPTLNPISNISLNENAGAQSVQLSGISSGAQNEQQSLTLTAVSSNPSLIPNPVVNYSSPGATATLSFTPVQNAYGSATITVTVNDGQSANNTTVQSFVVSVGAANRPPTLDALANVTIQENAGAQTVQLKGISAGLAGESQNLTVTAVSSNPALIPNPTVGYLSPNSTGSLTLRPVTDKFGSATITVTVNDGQAADNTVTRSFAVTVNALNRPPTLNPLDNVTILENAPVQMIALTGISAGAGFESQPLSITAVSSNPDLVPHPSVNYVSPGSSGMLSLVPAPNAFGNATITVTISDGQPENGSLIRTFLVTVSAVNQAPTLDTVADLTISEGVGPQLVALSGISSGATNENQFLSVTAISSNPLLIPNPTVSYASPNATGTISFAPVAFAFGTVRITVNVTDGQAVNSTISRSFNVNIQPVNQAPSLNPIANVSVSEDSPGQTINLSGITSGAYNENDTLSVTAVSDSPGVVPHPTVSYTSPAATGTLVITPQGVAGSASITVHVNDGQPTNNVVTRTFLVTVVPANQPPTLDPLNNLTLAANSLPQTINLSGITPGASYEIQPLSVTAVSSNPQLVPTPVITYTSPQQAGLLRFTLVSNAVGTATITVSVNDGSAQNGTFSRSFNVTVANQGFGTDPNRPPTLLPLPNLSITENAGNQTVPLAGISSGADNEKQILSVTAVSSNPNLIPHPTVSYTTPNTNGLITFAPVQDGFGSVSITVTVNDGQAKSNTVQRSFIVYVAPVNNPPTLNPVPDISLPINAGSRTVSLSGISSGAANEMQALTVSASSSDPSLVPNPVVTYHSGNSVGSLVLTPTQGKSGTAVISVAVSDGQGQNSTTTRQFSVNIGNQNNPPTLDAIPNVILPVDSGEATLRLSGITAGGETQPLSIIVSSSNPELVPAPEVNYVAPGTTAELLFAATPHMQGEAVITVRVDDGQDVSNIVERSFTVRVGSPDVAIGLGSTSAAAGKPVHLPMEVIAEVAVTNVSFLLEVPGTFSDFALEPLTAAIDRNSVRFTTLVSGKVAVQFSMAGGQRLPEGTVASLSTRPAANQPAGNVTLGLSDVTFTLADGTLIKNVPCVGATLAITGSQPTLEMTRLPSGAPALQVKGRIGASYAIEYTTDFTRWLPLKRIAATSASTLVSLDNSVPAAMYRVVEFTASVPVLEPMVRPDSSRALLVYGEPNANYVLEYTLNFGPAAVWQPLTSFRLTDSFSYQDVPNLGPVTLFRVRKQ